MARPPDALNRARALLTRRIGAGVAGPLDGVRALARQAGVAQATMVKAVGEMKRRGALATMPGRGTFVASATAAAVQGGGVPAVAAPGEPCEQKWQIVARTLRSDVVSARRSAGTALPSTKTLAAQHHVDQRTMRKALQRLCREGYLAPGRPGYAAADPPAAPHGSRVILVMRALPGIERPFAEMTQRTLELFRELERHCVARRIRIDCVFGHYAGTTFRVSPSVAQAVSQRPGNLLGFVLWTLALSEQQVALFAGSFAPYGLPVAVLDEVGAPGLPGAAAGTTRVVAMATGARCGQDMGRYLLRLGHRRIAYLDYEPLAPWSRARLAGLRDAFRQAGLDAAAVRCVTVGPESPSGFDTGTFDPRRMVPAGLSERDRGEAVRALQGIEGIIWGALRQERRYPRLRTGLEQVLRMGDITAWVASNDSLAVECLRFLKQRRVPVPGRVSVVGFDDEPMALHAGLTSYSFSPGAVARALADIVLRSPAALRRERAAGPIEVPGFISERHSTGAPPAH